MKNLTAELTAMITSTMDQIKNSKSSLDNNYSPKYQDPTTEVTANEKNPPFEGVNSMKISSMWTLKHEIRSQKLYEILINIGIIGDTAM